MAVFDRLVEINLGDIYESLGVKRNTLLDIPFRLPAWRFARQMVEFDRRVAADGLRPAAVWARDMLSGKATFSGVEHIPQRGPVLVLSNHPGLSDTLNLFAAIPREDLKVVAAYRPFLQALPNLSTRMIYVKADASERMSAFRGVVTALKAQGAILTFPAGGIEPDPAMRNTDARASIESWIDSVALLAKLVPETAIVPVIVRGVFDGAAYRNPIAQRRATLAERERMAAMMQVMWPGYQRNSLTVTFGPALSAHTLVAQHGDATGIMGAIKDAARALV
jgi:hypothetical protein